jgi:hypothetical protein
MASHAGVFLRNVALLRAPQVLAHLGLTRGTCRELDRVITSIRTTASGLQQLSHSVDQREIIPASVRQQVASLATEIGAQLGFVPQVGFEGSVDTWSRPPSLAR